MNRNWVEPAPLRRPSHTVAVFDPKLGEMHRTANVALVVAEELTSPAVERRRVMRANIEVAIDPPPAPNHKHRKYCSAATEDIFLGLAVRDIVERTENRARRRRSRPHPPYSRVRLAQCVSHGTLPRCPDSQAPS